MVSWGGRWWGRRALWVLPNFGQRLAGTAVWVEGEEGGEGERGSAGQTSVVCGACGGNMCPKLQGIKQAVLWKASAALKGRPANQLRHGRRRDAHDQSNALWDRQTTNKGEG